MRKLLFLILLLVYYIHTAQTNWHVAMNGSDISGNGSTTTPFASLQKAADIVQAGDTIFVHHGDYYNKLYGNGDIWKNDNLMTITANGNENHYIVIMPFPGDHVTLHSDAKYNIQVKNASYIKIYGFELEGVATDITQYMADNAWGKYKDSNGNIHDLATELDIDINDPSIRGTKISKSVQNNIKKPSYYNGHGLTCLKSHHIIFSNNEIHDFPGSGLRADKSDHVIIKNNKIYHNTYWTSAGVGALTIAASEVRPNGDSYSGVKIKIQKNYVHKNENRLISWAPSKNFIHMVIDEGSGIFLTRNADTYSTGYFLISNNISTHNGASGLVIHKTDRVIAEFNTVYKNGTSNDGQAGGIGLNTVKKAQIRNNITYALPDHWALGKNGGTLINVNISNNIIYNENGSEPVYHNISNSGFTITNPMLIDPDHGDYRLQVNSSAIDAGIASNYTNDDYDSNIRDNTPDIGAYEFLNSSAINYISKNKSLIIYPNPVNKYLRIGNLSSPQEKILKIYNSLGKLILTKKVCPISDRITVSLDFLKTGLYFIKIGDKVKRFIKI